MTFFYIDVRRFFKKVNPKKIEAATGKSLSSLYRYSSDPQEPDPDKRGTPMTCDFLIQITNSHKLDKYKRYSLLADLVAACGRELKDNDSKESKISIEKHAKQLEVLKSIFSAKNWQALQDGIMTSEEAAELIPYAEEYLDDFKRYVKNMKKKAMEAAKKNE